MCAGFISADTVVFPPPRAGTIGVIKRASACSSGCGDVSTRNWDSGDSGNGISNGSVEGSSMDWGVEGIGTAFGLAISASVILTPVEAFDKWRIASSLGWPSRDCHKALVPIDNLGTVDVFCLPSLFSSVFGSMLGLGIFEPVTRACTELYSIQYMPS